MVKSYFLLANISLLISINLYGTSSEEGVLHEESNSSSYPVKKNISSQKRSIRTSKEKNPVRSFLKNHVVEMGVTIGILGVAFAGLAIKHYYLLKEIKKSNIVEVGKVEVGKVEVEKDQNIQKIALYALENVWGKLRNISDLLGDSQFITEWKRERINNRGASLASFFNVSAENLRDKTRRLQEEVKQKIDTAIAGTESPIVEEKSSIFQFSPGKTLVLKRNQQEILKRELEELKAEIDGVAKIIIRD